MIRKVRFTEDELRAKFGGGACVPIINGLPEMEAVAQVSNPAAIQPILYSPVDPTSILSESKWRKEKINVQFSYKGVNYFFSANTFDVKLKEYRDFSSLRWTLEGRIDMQEFSDSMFRL